jgi:hypothetical protein
VIALPGGAVEAPGGALDLLGMKLGVLSGCLDPAILLRLKTAAAGLKDLSGDPRVDQVLAEIGLPVEVEFAKTRARGKPDRPGEGRTQDVRSVAIPSRSAINSSAAPIVAGGAGRYNAAARAGLAWGV